MNTGTLSIENSGFLACLACKRKEKEMEQVKFFGFIGPALKLDMETV